MTLVGPRPETVALAVRYPAELQFVFRYRPGITGPAQVLVRDEKVLGQSADVERFLSDRTRPTPGGHGPRIPEGSDRGPDGSLVCPHPALPRPHDAAPALTVSARIGSRLAYTGMRSTWIAAASARARRSPGSIRPHPGHRPLCPGAAAPDRSERASALVRRGHLQGSAAADPCGSPPRAWQAAPSLSGEGDDLGQPAARACSGGGEAARRRGDLVRPHEGVRADGVAADVGPARFQVKEVPPNVAVAANTNSPGLLVVAVEPDENAPAGPLAAECLSGALTPATSSPVIR